MWTKGKQQMPLDHHHEIDGQIGIGRLQASDIAWGIFRPERMRLRLESKWHAMWLEGWQSVIKAMASFTIFMRKNCHSFGWVSHLAYTAQHRPCCIVVIAGQV